jgi:hypothetical protein
VNPYRVVNMVSASSSSPEERSSDLEIALNGLTETREVVSVLGPGRYGEFYIVTKDRTAS